MSTMLKARLITAEEFEQFNPEWRYDLIKGELRPMPPMPGAEHGRITFEFSLDVGLFIRNTQAGTCFAAETRFIIEHHPDSAIGPDWAFVSKERMPAKTPTGFLDLAPDIVLEVRSPSDRKSEVMEKVNRWLTAGVRIVWELNPKTRILTVYRPNQTPRELTVEDTLNGEEVLPGFTLPLRQLFPGA